MVSENALKGIPNTTTKSYAVTVLEPVYSPSDGKYEARVNDSSGDVVVVCLRDTEEQARRAALHAVKTRQTFGWGEGGCPWLH